MNIERHIRDQVLAEGPDELNKFEYSDWEDYVNQRINGWNNVELLSRISDILDEQYVKCDDLQRGAFQ